MDERIDIEQRRLIEIQKTAIKEVISDWMDDKFRVFGRWSLHGLCVILFCIFVHILLNNFGQTTIHDLIKKTMPMGNQ